MKTKPDSVIDDRDAPRIPRDHRFPDFICIGAQKAATTWLHNNLRRHPKLWLPPMKELHYFNELYIPGHRVWTARHRREQGVKIMRKYFAKTQTQDLDNRRISVMADIIAGTISDPWYGRIFTLAEEEQVCGEICPDYATLPDDGIRHVLKLSPSVRVILSLRDPIERCWSQLRMEIKRGRAKGLSDLEAAAVGGDLRKRADYPAMIASWRRFIPEDRFLTIFMDDIESAPERVLERVCEFLGVKHRPKLSAKAANPVHAGMKHEIPQSVEAILKDRLRPIYDQLAALYPDIGANWMARHYS